MANLELHPISAGPLASAAAGVPVGQLDIVSLSPALGVEVRGVDLSRPLTDPDFERIKCAWERSCLVLFRDQHLSAVKQILLARRFGPIEANKSVPPVLYVGNRGGERGERTILPEGSIAFHSDQSYLEEPAMATLLYAMVTPSTGGETLFANGFAAYEALPAGLKGRLAGCSALHAYDYAASPTRRPAELPPRVGNAVHPIFRVHPPTGRKALYVSRLMTWSIVGMAEEESRRLLDRLFAHQERPEFVYRHRWRLGDLVIWDNRSCLHARTNFDPSETRRLRRVTVVGDRPYG